MTRTACRFCKTLVDVVDQEGNCAQCAAEMPTPPEVLGLEYLLASVPYQKGDRVECRTAGVIFDGVGTVQEVSFEIERGGGTPIFPAFLVKIDEPANDESPTEGWYTEVCLFREKVDK